MYPVYIYVTFNFITNVLFVFSANTIRNMEILQKKEVENIGNLLISDLIDTTSYGTYCT